jgi:hypothetical protein
VAPEQLGQAVGRHAVAAGCEQDLEHLFRPSATELGRPEFAVTVLEREWPEQPDHRPLRSLSRVRHLPSDGRRAEH